MRERVRTNKAGVSKSRVTMEISGESIGIGLDPRAYGRPVSEAIAQLLRERIQQITAVAAPATIKARSAFKKAVGEGKLWAMKRYSGGKIGQRDPGQSDRLFNDSGRFAESIAVGARPGDSAFTVNVAANRLSPDTLSGGRAALERIWQRLLQFIPELRDPAQLLSSIPVKKAVNEAVRDNVVKVGDARVNRVRQVMSARMNAAKAGLTFLRSLAG